MNDELNELFETAGTATAPQSSPRGGELNHCSPASSGPSGMNFSQWNMLGNGQFQPCGATCQQIPSGMYKAGTDSYGNILLEKIDTRTDDLMRLPDSAGDQVIEAIQRFWREREAVEQRGYLFKRGVLLWGPPGSGKTSTIQILAADLIKQGGIVMHSVDPNLTERGMQALRRVEPKRPLIVLLEDIDELCAIYGEARLLAVLDGETQTDNVVFIATTNYPERMDKRFINRPGRFDEIIKVGMPNASAREIYLRSKLSQAELQTFELSRLVADTEGFSIAHLRELIYAVFCDHRIYSETLKRLKGMARVPNSAQAESLGFAATR